MLSPLKKTEKGWEHFHDYHLTLLFIGELPEAQLPYLIKRMNQISAEPFTLITTNFHFFNRRIMYLGFEHCPEIYALRKGILEMYPEFGGKEEKDFIPHITVKRWQRYEHADLVRGLENHPNRPLSIPVKGLELFKSEKDIENRKYHVIHRTTFAN